MTRAAAALSWDGARVPASKLPVKARAFLGTITARKKLAALLSDGAPVELRICWVPHLRGGPDVLVPPFSAKDGRRLAFRTIRTASFGPILGVVYRH